jgi:hypothetical protein
MVFLDIVQEVSKPGGEPDANGNVRINTSKLKTERAVQSGETIDAGRPDQRRRPGQFHRRAGLEPDPGGSAACSASRPPKQDPRRTRAADHPDRGPQSAGSARPDRRIRQAGNSARWIRSDTPEGSEPAPAATLPIVLVPVGTDDDALDACLAALDAGTPAGTRVWLADDAQAGPRANAIIERWLARTPLQAAHTRRASPIGEAAHLDEACAPVAMPMSRSWPAMRGRRRVGWSAGRTAWRATRPSPPPRRGAMPAKRLHGRASARSSTWRHRRHALARACTHARQRRIRHCHPR